MVVTHNLSARAGNRQNSKYALERVLVPPGACVQPSFRKKLKTFSLMPLRSPASTQRREQVRQQIEREDISDASCLWACNDFAFVAEVKVKTIELRHRTLELLRKVDDAEALENEVPLTPGVQDEVVQDEVVQKTTSKLRQWVKSSTDATHEERPLCLRGLELSQSKELPHPKGSEESLPEIVIFSGETAHAPGRSQTPPSMLPLSDLATMLAPKPLVDDATPTKDKIVMESSSPISVLSQSPTQGEEGADAPKVKMMSIRGSMRANCPTLDISKMIKRDFRQQRSLGAKTLQVDDFGDSLDSRPRPRPLSSLGGSKHEDAGGGAVSVLNSRRSSISFSKSETIDAPGRACSSNNVDAGHSATHAQPRKIKMAVGRWLQKAKTCSLEVKQAPTSQATRSSPTHHDDGEHPDIQKQGKHESDHLICESHRHIAYPCEKPRAPGKPHRQETREGIVRIFSDPHGDEAITLQVHFEQSTRRKELNFERVIEPGDMEEMFEWGHVQFKSCPQQYSWLCTLAYIRHTDHEANGEAEKSCVGLKGFDDSVAQQHAAHEKDESILATEVHDLFEDLRKRKSLWQLLDGEPVVAPAQSPQNDPITIEIKRAVDSQGLGEDSARALHDWYDKERQCKNFKENVFIRKILRASGRPEMDDHQILSRCSWNENNKGFAEFVAWLCSKLPHVKSMSVQEVRRFAERVDHERPF